jgi:hypothetical protein
MRWMPLPRRHAGSPDRAARLAAQLLALMLQPKKLRAVPDRGREGDRLSAVGRTYSAFTRDHGMERVRASWRGC